MRRAEIHRFDPRGRDDRTRTVRVLLPDAYGRDSHARFPVLYLHDGQNLFDRGEHAVETPWGVDTILDAGTRVGAIPPWIVVAVDHAGAARLAEYSPWDEPHLGIASHAALHARFMIDVLRPWVDRTYRTLDDRGARGIGGSSMGGLVSLWLALTYGDTFGRVLALSPTTMWADHELARQWRTRARERFRIYLDAGERERFDTGTMVLDYGRATRTFAEHLRSIGFGADELRVVLDPRGEHNERTWRKRLPEALTWLLAPSDP